MAISCAGNPTKHGLRTAHRRQRQRNRDERAYANHVDHVGGGRPPKAHSFVEAAGRLPLDCLQSLAREMTAQPLIALTEAIER